MRLHHDRHRSPGAVFVAIAGDADAGRHEVHLSVEDLSSGLYILRLAVGEQMRSRRLTVVK